MLPSWAKLYGYTVIEAENYRTYEKIDANDNNKNNGELNSESDSNGNSELFIWNIPNDVSESVLFSLIAKYGEFTSMRVPKLMKKHNSSAIVLKYNNPNTAEKSNNFLDQYKISNRSTLHSEKCLRHNTLYLENLKLSKFSFYKVQQFFVSDLYGIKSIHFAAPNNYGRYAIRLEFFDYYTANLGKKIIEENSMFSKSREVNIDWSQRIGPRTEAAIKFEWKINESNKNDPPEIVIYSEKAVRTFQTS